MVIVTQNQYLVASKILSCTLDEHTNYVDYRKNGKYHSAREKYFQITILYVPEGSSQNHHGQLDTRECNVHLRGAVNAHKVFNDLMRQIREQLPDTLFLDSAVQKLLDGFDAEVISQKDTDHDALIMEDQSAKTTNRSPKALRKPRKAKRAGKGLLRATKKRR